MPNRWICAAVLGAAAVTGCTTAPRDIRAAPRLLTAGEMDDVSAGSAEATSDANAAGLGAAPQTATVSATLALSGDTTAPSVFSGFPIPPSATQNYASAQTVASAGNALVSQASGATEIGVDGGGGGASITAIGAASATGGRDSQAAVAMQFYAMSIGGTDIAFGTASATACCARSLSAQVDARAAAGGRYSRVVESRPVNHVPGQAQSRVDIVVVSSALPLLDAGQVAVLHGPAPSQLP